MARTLEEIADEVLQLPEESRAKLMERLLASFREPGGSEEEEIAQAWFEEAERRAREMDSGAVQGIPGDEVFARLRSLLE